VNWLEDVLVLEDPKSDKSSRVERLVLGAKIVGICCRTTGLLC